MISQSRRYYRPCFIIGGSVDTVGFNFVECLVRQVILRCYDCNKHIASICHWRRLVKIADWSRCSIWIGRWLLLEMEVGIRFYLDKNFQFYKNLKVGVRLILNTDFQFSKFWKSASKLNWTLTSNFFGCQLRCNGFLSPIQTGLRLLKRWAISIRIPPQDRGTMEVGIKIKFRRRLVWGVEI